MGSDVVGKITHHECERRNCQKRLEVYIDPMFHLVEFDVTAAALSVKEGQTFKFPKQGELID